MNAEGDNLEEPEQQQTEAMRRRAEHAANLMAQRLEQAREETVEKWLAVFEAEGEDQGFYITEDQRSFMKKFGENCFNEATVRMGQNAIRSGEMSIAAVELLEGRADD